ncbi:tetratricopeptide repeat protein [Ferrigenium sp. UT5]|uniref:L,D-transpeptidase Cds6 family protein n=1 Tax=Ferrigenium sp. UT5 TaxID=3242105 RepID=UPI0038B2B94A
MLKKIGTAVVACLLLSFSLNGGADEIQDANKLFKQGQLDQALSKVDAFLVTKPKDAQARFLKGLIVNEQGKPTEAIDIFAALTNDYPELPEPYNNLAVLYAGQGQYEKAKVALEMAIRTHPSYATAHENLGDIYAKMASQAYDRALQLDKSNAGTQTKLALIRELFDKGARAAKSPGVVLADAAPGSAVQPVAPAVQPTAPAAVASKPIMVAEAPVARTAPVAPVKVEPAPPITPAPVKVEPAPAKVEAAPVPVVAAADVNAEIAQATHDWAKAWSSRNVKQYLSFYAGDFKTPGGQTRGAWEAVRRERLTKPKSIQVGVSNLKVTLVDAQQARATFSQSYRASHFKSLDRKTLVWVKRDGRWLIAEERAGN